MRDILALILTTSPAAAWEFTPTPICTLSHTEAAVQVQVTYDPRSAIYAIMLTRLSNWVSAPVFAIKFDGARPLTITTNRQALNGPNLTVTDNGFGNVLDGLAYNNTATAVLGDQQIQISLEGAIGPVEDFRNCTEAPSV